MADRNSISRRTFLGGAAAGSAFLSSSILPYVGFAADSPKTTRAERLRIGVASYSLRKFDLATAIEITRDAGVRYLTLKDVHLSLNSTPAECGAAREQIEAAGLVLAGGGVITMNKAADVRPAFQYATAAGMPVIVCNPAPELLDEVEAEAKATGIRIAIHNHGPGDKRWPSPLTILEQIQRRDARVGICMDLGHTARLGQDPVSVIRKCGSRLLDFHIKDVTKAAPEGGATEVGRGVVDIVGVFKTLLKEKYPYHVALEYEINEKNPVPGMRESLGYIRGVMASLD